MNFIGRLILMFLCWFISASIAGILYEANVDTNWLIITISSLLFISISATVYCFVPNTIYRFVFGGSDHKFW